MWRSKYKWRCLENARITKHSPLEAPKERDEELIKITQTPYMKKKGKRKSPGSATITNRSPSQTLRGRGNRQIKTSTNRTNVRKALRLALSSPSEVIAILKGTEAQTKKNCNRRTVSERCVAKLLLGLNHFIYAENSPLNIHNLYFC